MGAFLGLVFPWGGIFTGNYLGELRVARLGK